MIKIKSNAAGILWIGLLALVLSGCASDRQLEQPMIDDAYLHLSPSYHVTEINAPRDKAAYVLSFYASMKVGQRDDRESLEARIRINEPVLQAAVGDEEIVFPLADDLAAPANDSSVSIYSLPFDTRLSPWQLKGYADKDQMVVELYDGGQLLASQPISRLKIDEPYFGESERWWASTDLKKTFGSGGEEDYFTVSFIYKGNPAELADVERIVFRQRTALGAQEAAVQRHNGSELDEGIIAGGHFEVAFPMLEHAGKTLQEAVNLGGMDTTILWETSAGSVLQEDVKITAQELNDGFWLESFE